MIDATSPSQEGFGGDGLQGEAVHAEVPITSRGDGHLFERIESGMRFEVAFERETCLFQQFDVGFTVGNQFFFKIERRVVPQLPGHLFGIPSVELASSLENFGDGTLSTFSFRAC